ncbi:T9SS sorting signal type C domain-containing protein [soil metagenome]
MKQIYTISIFFLPFWCFSQLYILPKNQVGSFMYVEGGLLYVEKNIDLKKNPAGEFEANIYLRNEGQLLQGAENIKNTGTGSLSVFQEGNATTYTYNYWGLPISINAQSTRLDDIFFEPLTRTHSKPAIVTSNYNGKANPLTISNRWIYKLSGNGTYSDWIFVGNNFNLLPGEGFTMKGVEGINLDVRLYGVPNNPGNAQRYDFRGTPNTGIISLNIKKDEVLLVGNPYPSALDLNRFLIENKNTTGIAYFWDSRPVSSHYLKDYEGGYGAYSPALGRDGYVPAVFYNYNDSGEIYAITGNTGEYYARRYSPVGQGFLVEGLSNGEIHFRNEYREFQKENPEFSEFKTREKLPDFGEIPFFRLNVTFKDLYTRQLLAAIHPAATPGIDRAMDAKNFSPLPTDVGFWNENDHYVIDVRNEFTEIPLSITSKEITTATFYLSKHDLKTDIFLWDREENIYYNLRYQEVSFSIPKGETQSRYWIRSTKNIEPGSPEIPVLNEFKIFQNNIMHRAEIISPLTSPPQIIGIYDLAGKKVKEVRGTSQDFHYEIPTGNLSKGIYIIKIISRDGTIVSKKVIISNL